MKRLNSLKTSAILSLCLLKSMTIYGQSCDIYFSCQNRSMNYITQIFTEKGVQIENEVLTISQVAPNIEFSRELNIIVFGQSQQSYKSTTQGVISRIQNQLIFPPEFYLPRPITLSDFFSPPNVVYTGSGCSLPNNPVVGDLNPCGPMGITASRSKTNQSNPNSIGLDADQSFRLNIELANRKVLTLQDTIMVNSTNFVCMVVKEKNNSTGHMEGSHWEISWYSKSYGLIQTKYFKTDPGSDWNKSGDLGIKRLVSWL